MAHARRERELAVHIGNQPGALAKLLALVADAGVNVLAYCTYSERHEGVVQLVTANALRAKLALEAGGFRCRMNDVVLVHAPDQVGAVAMIGARLGGAGVSILYSYASSTGTQFHAVFKTSDDATAVRVLGDGG